MLTVRVELLHAVVPTVGNIDVAGIVHRDKPAVHLRAVRRRQELELALCTAALTPGQQTFAILVVLDDLSVLQVYGVQVAVAGDGDVVRLDVEIEGAHSGKDLFGRRRGGLGRRRRQRVSGRRRGRLGRRRRCGGRCGRRCRRCAAGSQRRNQRQQHDGNATGSDDRSFHSHDRSPLSGWVGFVRSSDRPARCRQANHSAPPLTQRL